MPYEFRPAINKRFIRFFYDLWCSLGNLGKHFKLHVIQSAGIRDGDTILDIGCGTGVLLREVSKKYKNLELVGVDPDKEVLDIARIRLEKSGVKATLYSEYAENLSLVSNSVDVVISTLCFHHMPNDIKQQASREIYRVLKPSGTVVVADFGPGRKSPYWFEKKEYMEGNQKGLIPIFLKEAGFRNVNEVGKHFPGVSIIKGQK